MAYYSVLNTINSEANMYLIVGTRNCGKNYSTSHLIYDIITNNQEPYLNRPEILKLFKDGKAQFIYLRRYDANQLDKSKGKFFDSVIGNRIVNRGDTYYLLDKDYDKVEREVGYAFSLSSAPKGLEFPDVSVVVFDEFVSTKRTEYYLPEEFHDFAVFVETISRRRHDIIFLLLGNARSFYNPYTIGWKISLQPGQKRWRSDNHKVVYEKVSATGEEAKRERTLAGELFAGTEYDKWAGDNDFTDDSPTNVRGKSGNARYWCTIKFENFPFTIWWDKEGMYVSESKGEQRALYSLDKNNLKAGEFYFNHQNNHIARLKYFARRGLLFYESQKLKNMFQEVLAIILRR